MTGFDTLYDNHHRDDEIVRLALAQGASALARDREPASSALARHSRCCCERVLD
jgi:uncharacterized protein with PIN domain